MCYHESVLDRSLASYEDGGLDKPGTRRERIEDQIGRLSGAELKQSVLDMRRMLDRGSAELVLLVGELDQRHLTETDDHLTTASWLKFYTRMMATEASSTVKTAQAAPHMPSIVESALDGDVPAQSLRMLAHAHDRHRTEFGEHEGVFADVASYLSVPDMRRAISAWEQQVDYPSALAEARDASEQRSVFLSQTLTGSGDLRGTLSPEGYAIVKTALDAHGDPGNLDSDDTRTPSQRRADALVDIHRFWLDHNTDVQTSGGEKPHITVTVDYSMLTGNLRALPEIHGVSVSPEALRQLTCDAGIIPMVLGAEGEPLDVGRKTRTIPGAIRRAIEQIHDGCGWRGCSAPLSWCDIHHLVHWADGGDTKLDNLRPYCRRHHTAVHKLNERGLDPPDP